MELITRMVLIDKGSVVPEPGCYRFVHFPRVIAIQATVDPHRLRASPEDFWYDPQPLPVVSLKQGH